MRRAFLLLGLATALLATSLSQAQMSEEEKKELFLKARQDIRPVPRQNPTATPKPKPRSVSTPEPTPLATPTPEPTPRKAPPKKPSDDDEDNVKKTTPRPTSKEEKEPESTPPPKATPKPSPVAEETSVSPSKGKPAEEPKPDAPIVIEKSGYQASEGLVPAPKSSGGWFKRYKYLTPSVRRAIDNAPVQKGRWKYIVVHNSGTRQGNARIFDVYHRKVRKMVNGLAYHFVIGNGSSSGDGEIEIGSRWTRQINGGHVASDYLNNIALGICLVGDFNRDQPTKAQLAALDELIAYLRGRVGKVSGRQAIVMPHRMINPKPTDCPGDRFPYSWLKQKYGN